MCYYANVLAIMPGNEWNLRYRHKGSATELGKKLLLNDLMTYLTYLTYLTTS
jgi:hypothetical protein